VLDYHFTNQFKKDLKLMKKRGKDLEKIFEIIASLIGLPPIFWTVV